VWQFSFCKENHCHANLTSQAKNPLTVDQVKIRRTKELLAKTLLQDRKPAHRRYMTSLSTNAHHTLHSPVGKGYNMVGVFKHARVFFLIGLIFLFMFVPPLASMHGNGNPTQTHGFKKAVVNSIRTFHLNQDGKKRKDPLVKKFAGQSVKPDHDEETRWIRSVSVPNMFSYDIVQQPESDPYYVSSSNNLVTEFSLAREHGTIGLVAHNNLAGNLFNDLVLGQEIQIVYTDGHTDRYTVSAIYRFRALEPTNTESQFVDLDSKEVFTATELFERMYTGAPHVTFQTCIYASGDPSWGRFFAVAIPMAGTE